jgi:hypothetical protein
MASSLTFSTVLGGNTVTATIDSPDDAGVQADGAGLCAWAWL